MKRLISFSLLLGLLCSFSGLYAQFDYKGLPQNLNQGALAIHQVNGQQYYSWENINKTLIKKFKKYPFPYGLIPPGKLTTQKEMMEAGYAFELRFQRAALDRHQGGQVQHLQEKDLFWVYVLDLKSGKTYCNMRYPDQYPYAFRDFVKSVKKSFGK